MLTKASHDDCLVLVDETNKSSMHHQAQPNALYYFELNHWQATNAFRNFSVKFVLDGMIHYKIGKSLYPLRGRQVLIANKQPDVVSYFESSGLVKSICMNFDAGMMASAYTMHHEKNGVDPEKLLANEMDLPGFHEKCYSVSRHDFLQPLCDLAVQLSDNKRRKPLLNEEFFLNLSENIIIQVFHTERIQSLDRIRFSTRKEILRRLEIAKDYLRAHFLERPSVTDLARICNLSQYHFFRAFKQAYKMSPHQYQLKLRLEKGRQLIRNPTLSLLQVAEQCAYPDLPTFSKSFRRAFGHSPSTLRMEDHAG